MQNPILFVQLKKEKDFEAGEKEAFVEVYKNKIDNLSRLRAEAKTENFEKIEQSYGLHQIRYMTANELN